MECRLGCGACCIAPSISSALPGMPAGKPAGVRCVNLDDKNTCRIWNQSDYPKVCREFVPQRWVCGDTETEAMHLISALEKATKPGVF